MDCRSHAVRARIFPEERRSGGNGLPGQTGARFSRRELLAFLHDSAVERLNRADVMWIELGKCFDLLG
jgi:hypothetical protein